ncbi:MAG: ATP-binding cassette domain-containing protein [Rectinemataceae bacterium]|nr:ATP-binding cassette domain-containing protein [Spirochaetaceae bacterium]
MSVHDAVVQHAPEDVAIWFRNVHFAYREAQVFRDVSFHVHAGEFVTLTGKNGAGKSTLLKLVVGLLKPTRGEILVFGRPPQATRAVLGYVPQHAAFDPSFPISVREVVAMGRLEGLGLRSARQQTNADAAQSTQEDWKESIERALVQAEVADLADRPYAALSGGQRRRVLVARALVGNPRILVLDEPTANLDVTSEKKFHEVLANLKYRTKTTVLIATHDAEYISALADVVLCVGQNEERAHSVHRHATEPAHLASELYGGDMLHVRHDIELPDDVCCRGED